MSTGHWRTLWRMVRAHPAELADVRRWTLIGFVPTFLIGRLVAFAVDAVISQDIAATVGWLTLLAAVGLVDARASRRLVVASAVLAEAVRGELAVRLVTGTLGADLTGPSRGAAEVTTQLEMVRENLMLTIRFAPRVLGAVVGMAGIATLSPLLVAILLPFVAVGVPLYVWNVGRIVERTRALVLAQEAAMGALAGALDGVRDIVATRAERRTLADVDRLVTERAARSVAAADEAALGRTLLSAALAFAPLVVVLALTPWLLRRGLLSVGGVVGAVTYLQLSLTDLTGIATIMTTTLVALFTTLARITELTGQPLTAAHRPPEPTVRRHGSALAFRDVRFAYSDHSHPIVDGLDLDLPAGTHLAIVGPSGIGKSTLAGLAGGLLAPTAGAVTLGGTAVTSLNDEARRATLAIVPQQAYVFSGTLRENLTYLDPDASEDRILTAADRVGLSRVLDRLGGLDAPVTPTTSGLSEGERQLIALTRVYLSPATIVVLDEATCYLDPLAEERAERAFIERGGTLIVIAHRMSSSLRAGQILVMDGTTIQLGDHADLLRRNALYADLHGIWADNVTPVTSPGADPS